MDYLQYLQPAQIIVSILIIIFILLQQRGSALGSLWGGEGGFYSTRRGVEKNIFGLTCILIIIFFALALANLFF
ncbi:MAG: preprotein translocase subunit SecG [Patescibacteria group bacterium]